MELSKIKTLIQKGHTDLAINSLIRICEQRKRFADEISLISNSFQELKRKNLLHTVSNEESTVMHARINQSLLKIIVKLDSGHPNLDLKVRIWAQKNDSPRQKRDINILPKEVRQEFIIGDEICFGVQANQDCHLVLVSLGTSGKSQILFPNQFEGIDTIKGGIPFWYPNPDSSYTFQLGPPSGVEIIKAIISTSPLTYTMTAEEGIIFKNQEYKESSCSVIIKD